MVINKGHRACESGVILCEKESDGGVGTAVETKVDVMVTNGLYRAGA